MPEALPAGRDRAIPVEYAARLPSEAGVQASWASLSSRESVLIGVCEAEMLSDEVASDVDPSSTGVGKHVGAHMPTGIDRSA